MDRNLQVIKKKVNKDASTSAELDSGVNNIDCASCTEIETKGKRVLCGLALMIECPADGTMQSRPKRTGRLLR